MNCPPTSAAWRFRPVPGAALRRRATPRAAPGIAVAAGWRIALLAASLLASPAARAQDGVDLVAPDPARPETQPEAEMQARVAAEFPDPWLVRFRKVRRIVTEAGGDVAFCGQVSAAAPGAWERNYHLFLYERTGTAETVRILGAESLNGYRVGRKMIGALRRVGCL